MPKIKPISDLRKYTEILKDISEGTPVFLTKNGRGCYAIMNLQDYEKMQASLQLFGELSKGEQSTEKGWLPVSRVKKDLGLCTN